MKLHDLLDKDLLGTMMELGYVDFQVHPTENLGILNYSKKAAWDGEWNDVTTACRGLIYDHQTYEVIARPFPKFFNYEQLGPEWEIPDGPVVATDKQDGSLGILYPLRDGGHAVATRGSFMSDQAKHATQIWNEKYEGKVLLEPGITYLFEIIYPENRIVLNYGSMDDLVLLGGVIIDSGSSLTAVEAKFVMDWPGPVTKTFPGYTFEEVLRMPPRENAEGIVVHFLATGERVKLKQEDYVALHRVITGMTDRSVWEALGQGKTVEEIQEPLPEEFWPWVEQVAEDLFVKCERSLLSAWDAYLNVTAALGPDFTRKDFAEYIKDYESPLKGYLFKYLDGESIRPLVWKTLKPAAVRSLVEDVED